MPYSKTCAKCGQEFVARHPKALYCSKTCGASVQRKRRYARKVAAGICVWCMKHPAIEGQSRCEACREKGRKRVAAWTPKKRREAYDKKRAWIQTKDKYYLYVGQKSRHKLRMEVFGHYGMQCACCGESDWRFLTIDHINNDGSKQRMATFGKQIAGVQFYSWLRRNGFPEGYQTLCFNCNCAKSRFGGICPHKIPLDEVHPQVVSFTSVD
jgi:hypothetical protein